MADVNTRALTQALNGMMYLKGRFENGLLTVARFLALLGILVHNCFNPPDEEQFEILDRQFKYVMSVNEYADQVALTAHDTLSRTDHTDTQKVSNVLTYVFHFFRMWHVPAPPIGSLTVEGGTTPTIIMNINQETDQETDIRSMTGEPAEPLLVTDFFARIGAVRNLEINNILFVTTIVQVVYRFFGEIINAVIEEGQMQRYTRGIFEHFYENPQQTSMARRVADLRTYIEHQYQNLNNNGEVSGTRRMLGIVYYVHYIWVKYALSVPRMIDSTEEFAEEVARLCNELAGRMRDDLLALGLAPRARAAADADIPPGTRLVVETDGVDVNIFETQPADPPMPRGILVAGPDDAEPNEPEGERRARTRTGTFAFYMNNINQVIADDVLTSSQKIARIMIIARDIPPMENYNPRLTYQHTGVFLWSTTNFDRRHTCIYIENYVKKQIASSSGARAKLVNTLIAVDWLASRYEVPPDADIFRIEGLLM